ncbi:MAG: peptidoglycan DD-metalloendopeptidase family protein [Lachnospiraceae bacterium]|nr:peptidoglycan DD-metalloendopeptidase family protein [Lachnospiraceae bacterium]
MLAGIGVRGMATGSLAQPGDGSEKKAESSSDVKTYESIINKQNEISKIEDERKDLQNGLSDLKKIKKQLEDQKTNLKNYVSLLDNSLAEMEAKITELKVQIAAKEQQIDNTQKELDAALLKQENQRNAMYARMRLMYEKGDSYMTEMMLKAASFGEFLNRADYMEKIMEYDQRMWEEYKANAQLIALIEQELEIEKIFLDQAKATVEEEQKNIETLIEQKNRDILDYETDINNKTQAIRDYESMIAQQNSEIEALERAIAEEKRIMQENNGTVLTYDGGTFKFPLASYTRISDDYGMRMHPTLGVEKFHNGIDLAAPAGTAIYAAYNGKVVAAAYSESMGNYVMIDHGDGLYTIYMHASALYVSKGDVVTRGETIAAVGTTGRSTGNHLHFGVRKDGAYVSPWNYLSL